MKILKISILVSFAALLVLSIVGCQKLTTTKDVADRALSILRSLRGAAGQASGTKGETSFFNSTFKVDSFYLDETKFGVRTVGWIYWDDADTPSDTTDDIFSFKGQKFYLDWNVTENWFLKVMVDTFDRATEMAVKNVTTAESLYVNFGKVTRPGGLQQGPGKYANTSDTIDVVMGIHHANTPSNYEDNYSFLEFFLYDGATDPPHPYWVHADFRPGNSGSGEIHDTDMYGEVVATFEWDEFGRGTLVVGGDIYPFKW